jgi:hypothetical protein
VERKSGWVVEKEFERVGSRVVSRRAARRENMLCSCKRRQSGVRVIERKIGKVGKGRGGAELCFS